MIISRTPYRISFFGGGSDYPEWYLNNGGAVLATTIDKYCYLTCRYLPPFFEHKYRICYSKIEACQHINEIQHPAVRAILGHLGVHRGVEIHHDGDLPAWSGIGTSSSFAVGLLHAVHALQGRIRSKHELAMESIYIEQELMKETVGSQDQTMAAYGGFNTIEFHTNGEISVNPVTIDVGRLQAFKEHLLLFYTGQSRQSSEVAASYVTSIRSKEKQLALYEELRQQAVRLLNEGGDLKEFGELLHEAWLAKRSLSSKVSTRLIDDLYKKAREAGALGGKILGAGGGGFFLVYAEPSKHQNIMRKLDEALPVPFDFDRGGTHVIFYDPEAEYVEAEARRDFRMLSK